MSGGSNPGLRQEISRASGTAIRNVVPHLKANWRSGVWLRHRNVYRKNAIQRIRSDVQSGSISRHSQLSEYVAASAIVHCLDGWSFLGHALHAELTGDPDVARHLGYYAELRAAMAILASEGIGVFDKHHIVVTDTGRCEPIVSMGGTHAFAWAALDAWAGLDQGRTVVLQAIKPGGIPLLQWLSQASIGSHHMTTDWLRKWGLDLSRLAKDRFARNIASYRPTAFATPGPRELEDTVKGILDFWAVCDPGPAGGFPILDGYLLRRSLQGRLSSMTKKQYEKSLNTVLANIQPRVNPSGKWELFLAYDELKETHTIFDDANGRADAHDLNHSKQVLARATLLLRLATGCSASLLSEAEPGMQSDLSFWRTSSSVRRHLWASSAPPASSIDLWSDVANASSDLDGWLRKYGSSACHHGLWAQQAVSASILTSAERVFLWGVGL